MATEPRRRQTLLAETIVMTPPGRARHAHAANEFILITHGRGFHRTNRAQLPFRAGDLHFFARGQFHDHLTSQRVRAESVRFRADALLAESEVDQQAQARLEFLRRRAHLGENRIPLPAAHARRARELFGRALREDYRRESGYRCMLKGIALELIVIVARGLGFRWPGRGKTPSGIVDVLEHLESDPAVPATVEAMARRAHLSRSQFHAVFKRATGTTLLQHVARLRVGKAMQLLAGSAIPIVEVCYECGFPSVSRFYETFARITRVPPGEYRRRHGGAHEPRRRTAPGSCRVV